MKKYLLFLIPFLLISTDSFSGNIYKCKNEKTGKIEYQQSQCMGNNFQTSNNPDATFSAVGNLHKDHYKQRQKMKQLKSRINRIRG
jgi:hypothetical protein